MFERLFTIFTISCIAIFMCNSKVHAQKTTSTVRIDSIAILKNWRTHKSIIEGELGFQAGERIKKSQIDSAIRRVWLIGNFVDVNYRIDSLTPGKNILILTAKDKLTIVPDIYATGNKTDYKMGCSLTDNNFAGRNIGLSIGGVIKRTGKEWNFKVKIPRQLLPKNSTIAFGAVHGTDQIPFKTETKNWLSYAKTEIFAEFGNPNNTDFGYRFSPNIGFAYLKHRTDTTNMKLTNTLHNNKANYNIQTFEISLSENIGIIEQQRHRKNGYAAMLQLASGVSLGLQKTAFYSISARLEYHHIFNSWLQISTSCNSGYTSSNFASLQFHIPAEKLRGIQEGELFGKSYYYAYAGAHITWINTQWLALEQAFFVNWGHGGMQLHDTFTKLPRSAIGTSFTFNVPMVSFLAGQISLSYSISYDKSFDVSY